MVSFSGCLMSSANIQKLFCGIYSVFKYSFDEFLCMILGSVSYHSFTCSCLVFPEPFTEKIVFSPLIYSFHCVNIVLQHCICFMCRTYFYVCIPYNLFTTDNWVSIHYNTVAHFTSPQLIFSLLSVLYYLLL